MLNIIKKKLQQPIDQFAKILSRMGLTPTIATLLGLICASVSGIAYYGAKNSTSLIIVAFVFLALSGFFDAIDGAIARLSESVTNIGGVLDSVCDRIEEIIVIVGIVAGGFVSAPIGLIALSGSLMVSYVRTRVENEGGKMIGVGVAERPERLIILACTTAIGFVDIGIYIIAILSWITVAQRMIHANRILGHDYPE